MADSSRAYNLPTGAAKLAGVIGWPVKHSLSPVLHGFWLQRYGVDGCYVPLPVHPDKLRDAIRALPGLGFRGINATLPHKENLLSLMDEVEDKARIIGAVNTVIVGEDGTLKGSNSDAFGFLENLKQGAPSWRPGSGPAVVLGAGGAARAIVVALADAGAPLVRILNRTEERARDLVTDLSAHIPGRLNPLPWTALDGCLGDAHLVVNTTALGMDGQPPLTIDLDPLPSEAVVTDIVYTPLETDLLKTAKRRELCTVDGLGMLLHQARAGFEAWFGVAPEVSQDLRDVLIRRLEKRKS